MAALVGPLALVVDSIADRGPHGKVGNRVSKGKVSDWFF